MGRRLSGWNGGVRVSRSAQLGADQYPAPPRDIGDANGGPITWQSTSRSAPSL